VLDDPDGLFGDEINLLLGRKATDAEAQAGVRRVFGGAKGTQDVGGFERSRGAGRAGGDGDVLHGHEERFTLDVAEGKVQAASSVSLAYGIRRSSAPAGEAMGIAVTDDLGALGDEAVVQAVGEALDVGVVIL
jgi:hypothetical protein